MEIKCFVVGPLLTNCYYLVSGKEVIVIDPGGGLRKILKELKDKKLNYIILTHYHLDHTLVAQRLKEETGAKILIHKEEKDFIKSLPFSASFQKKEKRLVFQPDQFLEDGEEINLGNEFLKIIHTPGHTKGSICILGKDFILTGDTIFEEGYGRTDLPGGSKKDLENSLKKLEKIIQPGMIIYPGHGPVFRKPFEK